VETVAQSGAVIYLELKENLTKKYFSTNYNSFKLTDIQKSNKTLNQYKVGFGGDRQSMSEFIMQLENDPNVLTIKRATDELEPPTNGSNSKMGKTKPIGN